MNELEKLYKKTLENIQKKEAELEKEKNLLVDLEAKLLDYLQEHKGKLYKITEKHVPFESAWYWKQNFPKIHAECSVTVETKRFDINLVKENYPKKFKKASKQMEQVITEK